MKIDREDLPLVATTLAEYLNQPVYGDAIFAEQHQALPLYASWTGTTYLTTAGQFWFRNCEYDPPRIEKDLNESLKLVALVLAAERHPQLAKLLPTRPADARDCEDCGGRGQITVGVVSNIICGRCSALGWRSTSPDRKPGSYPSFDSALAEFRSFAAEHGLPGNLVFVSPEHALLVDDQLHITADALCPEAAARAEYETAVARQLGVAIGAVGELPGGYLGVYIYGPSTENEAERLMYPNGLKMAIPERQTLVRMVSRLRVKWLQLRYARLTTRTREYFR